MFGLTDDLLAGIDLPPTEPETPWQPGDGELPEVSPTQVVSQAAARITELLRTPTPADATKEQLNAHRAGVTSAYQLLAQLLALAGQQELLRKLPAMKVEQLLDVVKTFATHGSMVPKDDKSAGGGFSLNIIMPGATPAPTIVVENSPAALPES